MSSLATLEEAPPSFLKYPLPDPNSCQILKLPDGRHMSFSQSGSTDPSANPFIFIHGIPDTRLVCLTSADAALARCLNVRWIGIDRPGYGLSTLHPGRSVLGWVDDLRCLIEHLRLTQYRILGVSGGTPYALAAAKLLPRENLRGVGVGFGVAPVEAGTAGLNLLNRFGFRVWKHFPASVLEAVMDRAFVAKVHTESRAGAEELVRKELAWMSPRDRDFWSGEEASRALVNIHREVCRQGSTKGWVEDSKLATGHWGFELEDVGYPGVRLWYGTRDVNTPPEQGRYMAVRLPGAVLKEYEGETHFTMWKHLEEMMTDLLQSDGPTNDP